MAVVVASSPGKVLLTGGYLILERPNAGIVLSTNARFYAIIKPIHRDLNPDSLLWSWADVKLTSPQLSRQTEYKMSLKNSALQCISPRDLANPFVEQAVQYAVAAAHTILVENSQKDLLHKRILHGLDITILGSNDFYSYRNQIEARGLPLTPEALASLPPFSSITFNSDANGANCKPEVAKTGLGSSAAMTTAVVAALLQYLGVVKLPLSSNTLLRVESEDLDLVHMVAQSAHCIAQGKVGSGFDVSSAVYGSQRYVRFSPGVLSSAQGAANCLSSQEVITDVLKGKWDHEKTKFSLPPLMTLLLGEPGSGGSSTPSMVGAVKKWQASEPQKSQETWKRLSDANSLLENQLNALSMLAEEQWETYKYVLNSCSNLNCEKWKEHASDARKEAVVKALLGARDSIVNIRCHMRKMGDEAGVPIEPESQTKLLDATMNLEGVLLAGVPGAGGFDAIFAITLGECTNKVTNMWSSRGVMSLLVREDPRGVSIENEDPRIKGISSGISSVHIN